MMFTVPLHIHPEMNVITQTNKKEKNEEEEEKYTKVLQWLGLLYQDYRITLEVPNVPPASPWE